MGTPDLVLEGSPLSTLFDEARALYEKQSLSDGNCGSQADRRCFVLLVECAARIRQLSLFSSNEEMDDVATADLKYLLVPYMQADVVYRSPLLERKEDPFLEAVDAAAPDQLQGARHPFAAPSPQELAPARLQGLLAAHRFLEEFTQRCDALQLVPQEERALLVGAADSDASAPMDAAAKRALKVARFKKEKELRQRLDALRARRAAGQRLRVRRKGVHAVVGGEGEELDGEEEAGVHARTGELSGAGGGESRDVSMDEFLDESEERQLWLLELKSSWVKALELEQSLKREEEMLQAAAKASREQGPGGFAQPLTREELERSMKEREASHRRTAMAAAAELRAGSVPPPNVITCGALAQDVIEGRAGPDQVAGHKHATLPMAFGPVSLMRHAAAAAAQAGNAGSLSALGARQLAAARVFQPSHSLPGMSIEEAGLREMKMMDKWKERTRREMEAQGLDVLESDGGLAGIQDGGDGGDVGEEEGEDMESDDAVMRARAWDDWKDDHPRGAGNSKLKPCG